jgi:hypothetical protein
MNPKGEIGAASMNSKFALDYAVWRGGASSMHRAKVVYP